MVVKTMNTVRWGLHISNGGLGESALDTTRERLICGAKVRASGGERKIGHTRKWDESRRNGPRQNEFGPKEFPGF